MNKRRTGLGLAVLLAAASCSNTLENWDKIGQAQSANRNPYYSSPRGGRLAAVLSKTDNCSPSSPFGAYNQAYSQLGGTNRLGSGTLGGGRPFNGLRGRIDILSLNYDSLDYVGPSGPGGGRFATSPSAIGTAGRPAIVSWGRELVGLSARSQMAYTRDRSLIVTLPDDDSILVFPAPDRGTFQNPYRIGLLGPTEIATGYDPDLGVMVAVATREGVAFIRLNRLDRRTGKLLPTAPEIFKVDTGMATALAFKGSWLFAGTDPTVNGSGATGRVAVCDMHAWAGETQTMPQTMNRGGRLERGCYTGDSSAMAGLSPAYSPFNTGYQNISMGVPRKIAVGNRSAVALTDTLGPYILVGPEVDDLEVDLGKAGFISRTGWVPAPQNTSRARFTDIALNPLSDNDNVIALVGSKIVTFPLDNPMEVGNVLNVRSGFVRPVALAVDPGPDPTFVLVADEGAAAVYVGRLSNLSVQINPTTDYVQMPFGACPIDVAIQPGIPTD